jgi:hypothetical protein
MISLEKLRKIDPELTSSITDKELEDIRNSFYEFGQLMFDDWHDQKFGSKSPVGVLTSKEIEHKI